MLKIKENKRVTFNPLMITKVTVCKAVCGAGGSMLQAKTSQQAGEDDFTQFPYGWQGADDCTNTNRHIYAVHLQRCQIR